MKLLKEIFGSKKALTAMAGVLLVVAQYFGLPIDEAIIIKLLAILSAYIVGQGIADIGKPAKKLELEEK